MGCGLVVSPESLAQAGGSFFRRGAGRRHTMEAVLQVVQRINFYLSDYILVFLLIGTGLYFSVRTRFVQVRCFGEGMRAVFGEFNMQGGRQKGGLSSFQALTTAIAAQVGTGNIIGACGAILLGGPGAIFWMWIIAFFGMATIYAEAVLAQEPRRVAEGGSVSGGPVYYIKRAFPGRFGTFLAGFFAVALILALGFMGCMVQSNSIGETCAAAFGVPSWAVGIVVAVLAAVVFLGGIQRIAGVTEKLVPIMAALYLLEAYVKKMEIRNESSSERIIMESPDELAADYIEGFEVTSDMPENYSSAITQQSNRNSTRNENSCHLRFTPKKLTQKITVKIRIKGMNNIRKATCTLDGIAESIFLVSRQNSEKTVTQVLRLSNPVYDSGSVTEGTLSTTISVFGFDVEIPHNLHLKAKLVDGKTIFEESFNDLAIRRLDEEDGTMSVFIDMACEKTVPNVKTEGSSGFDADVDKWDDEVNSDIDI